MSTVETSSNTPIQITYEEITLTLPSASNRMAEFQEMASQLVRDVKLASHASHMSETVRLDVASKSIPIRKFTFKPKSNPDIFKKVSSEFIENLEASLSGKSLPNKSKGEVTNDLVNKTASMDTVPTSRSYGCTIL